MGTTMTFEELRGRQITVPAAVMMRELDGEAFMLNLETEQYYGLDEVGTRMWTVLTTSDTVEDACAQLKSEFKVDEADLREHLAALVTDLDEHGLVTLSPTPSPPPTSAG